MGDTQFISTSSTTLSGAELTSSLYFNNNNLPTRTVRVKNVISNESDINESASNFLIANGLGIVGPEGPPGADGAKGDPGPSVIKLQTTGIITFQDQNKLDIH